MLIAPLYSAEYMLYMTYCNILVYSIGVGVYIYKPVHIIASQSALMPFHTNLEAHLPREE